MKLKEKMMDSMMNKMSSEEMKEMMNGMMEGFFSGMSEEEKKEMMREMMPKMMQQMMGGSSPMTGMMGMMGKMMGRTEGSEDEGFKPWEMCEKMMASISKNTEVAAFATSEVRELFSEWAGQIEEEMLDFINQNKPLELDMIAEKFSLSKNSVIYFIGLLAQKGKIRLKVE